MRKTARTLPVALLTLFAPLPATAQDREPSDRPIFEMLGHTALMDRIAQADATLAPFETDGCSGGLSDAWQVIATRFPAFEKAHQSQPAWEECCVIHDRAYHAAGNVTEPGESFDARLAADGALRACVVETGAERAATLGDTYDLSPDQFKAIYEDIAQAMFVAVRYGGAPCSGLSWRWGYGYPPCSIFPTLFGD